jgi:hypothetical protein
MTTLSEFFINAVKVGVPVTEAEVRHVIRTFNEHVKAMAHIVALAPLDYDEFIDRDQEVDVLDRHEAFDHCMFAEVLSDHWTLLQCLYRNGINEEVRGFATLLDFFVLGADVVDHLDSLDL